MFSPLLFADWGAIARGATFVSWLAVLVLAAVIGAHFIDVSPAHLVAHVPARR